MEPTGDAARPTSMQTHGRRRTALVVAAAALVTVGVAGGVAMLGRDPAPTERQAPDPVGSGGPVELIAAATVLEDRSHGPQLCLGGILTSLPIQCGGPDIPNWDWDAVAGENRLRGTVDGHYVVIGTYDPDAATFTLTRPAVRSEEYAGPLPAPEPEREPYGTPCPEPAGGWRVVDPARTSYEAQDRTLSRATRMPGFAGAWLDQSRSDAAEVNDPEQLILNIAFTGDLETREAELRETWGGRLCVSEARHTEAELRRIQREVGKAAGDGFLFASSGHDRVELGVIHDDGTLQRRLDERYGVGLVTVTSALQPYAGAPEASPSSEASPSPEVSPSPEQSPSVAVVPEEEADLHLWVSNQSFAHDPVRLTVTVDGTPVVDQDFFVEGQHNWQLFPLSLPEGRHEVVVTSDTGVLWEGTFRTGPERRYAVVDFWKETRRDDTGHVTWRIQDEPLAFA